MAEPDNREVFGSAGEAPAPAPAVQPEAPPAPSPPPPRPWGFWATLGWSALLGIVWLILQLGLGVGLYGAISLMAGWAHKSPQGALEAYAGAIALSLSAVTNLATLALVAGVVLARRVPIREYLGLAWPRAGQVAITLVLLVLGIAGSDLVLYLAGGPIVSDFDVRLYKTSGSMLLVVAGILIMAPLFEELAFRGFMFKGIAESKAGPVVAVVLTSLAWAITHQQYEWLRIAGIFVMGLFLGVVRWRTASTPLAVILHSVANLIITLEIVVAVHLYGR